MSFSGAMSTNDHRTATCSASQPHPARRSTLKRERPTTIEVNTALPLSLSPQDNESQRSTAASAHAPEPKKRKTMPGSRGVANLTPGQLAKKRANGMCRSPHIHPLYPHCLTGICRSRGSASYQGAHKAYHRESRAQDSGPHLSAAIPRATGCPEGQGCCRG